jgi:hypothetical protein
MLTSVATSAVVPAGKRAGRTVRRCAAAAAPRCTAGDAAAQQAPAATTRRAALRTLREQTGV